MRIRSGLVGLPARTASTARRFGVVVSLVLLGCGQPASANEPPAIANAQSSAPAAAAALQGQPLVEALRRGGWVVYFRHTATDFSRNDAAMRGYDDCANQRLLSPQGRRDAAEIGQHIRGMGLPVGEALASPFCRTLEHARLMLPGVVPRHEIREAEGGDYAGLKRLLASPVAAGGNRWIVGHGTPFRAVAGPPHLAEGEAVVIRPEVTGWTVVARLNVADWQALPPGR
ncbi:MAG: histidine phosphatase family protein [Burkholderiaceae bacterium]|nr:histidine phosphatase family protein [Burkholderiaceae bacterium]